MTVMRTLSVILKSSEIGPLTTMLTTIGVSQGNMVIVVLKIPVQDNPRHSASLVQLPTDVESLPPAIEASKASQVTFLCRWGGAANKCKKAVYDL